MSVVSDKVLVVIGAVVDVVPCVGAVVVYNVVEVGSFVSDFVAVEVCVIVVDDVVDLDSSVVGIEVVIDEVVGVDSTVVSVEVVDICVDAVDEVDDVGPDVIGTVIPATETGRYFLM